MPFIPFNAHQDRKKKAPTQAFTKKHRGSPGNPNSPKNVKQFKQGRAHGKGQPNNKGAIQRAAGKRLFHGKPGAFAQENYRDK
jgi:hypothetical protein